jgi:NAD(P)H dehydrogenase (quinone)
MSDILILYYSRHGAVKEMARWVAHGVERVAGCRRACVPCRRSRPWPKRSGRRADAGAPYCELADLEECAGLRSAARRASATWPRR